MNVTGVQTCALPICRKFKFVKGDVLERGRLGVECPSDFAAGGISMRMQDAVAAVRRLTCESQLGSLAVELRSPLDQLLNPVRPFFHQDARGVGVHDPITRVDGVLKMQADLVFVAQRYRDAALRVLRR